MAGDKVRRRFAIIGKPCLPGIVEGEQFSRQSWPLPTPVGADFAEWLGMPQGPKSREYLIQRPLTLLQVHLTAALRSRRR